LRLFERSVDGIALGLGHLRMSSAMNEVRVHVRDCSGPVAMVLLEEKTFL
jgi:hypothetical protein